MADVLTLKLNGFKELGDKLRSMGPKIERRGLRGSAFAGAKVIRDATKQTQAFRDVSGLLRANIAAKRRRGSQGIATYSVIVRSVDAKKGSVRLRRKLAALKKRAGPAQYGRFLEFGTSRMAPHAFMRPAFMANADRAIEAMRQSLATSVEGAAK